MANPLIWGYCFQAGRLWLRSMLGNSLAEALPVQAVKTTLRRSSFFPMNPASVARYDVAQCKNIKKFAAQVIQERQPNCVHKSDPPNAGRTERHLSASHSAHSRWTLYRLKRISLSFVCDSPLVKLLIRHFKRGGPALLKARRYGRIRLRGSGILKPLR